MWQYNKKILMIKQYFHMRRVNFVVNGLLLNLSPKLVMDFI